MKRSGKKSTAIRWQYFNCFLIIAISAYGLVAIFELVEILENAGGDWSVLFSEGNADAAAYREYLLYSVCTILPVAVLALLNRFCFGKVICTADKDGLHLDDRIIEWSALEKAEYNPTIPLKSNFKFAAVELSVKSDGNFPANVTVDNFPLYGLRVIKKYAPDVRVCLSGAGWFVLVCPIVTAAVFIFIAALGVLQ